LNKFLIIIKPQLMKNGSNSTSKYNRASFKPQIQKHYKSGCFKLTSLV
jgi:hypothetical protein